MEHIDNAAEKLDAISRRGSKKDFIDLYFLLQHFTLEEMLDFYVQKYPHYSVFRVRMTLTYFEDAEQQENPTMFENVDWKTVKNSVSEEVRKIDWNRYKDN